MNKTNNPKAKSWVEIPKNSDFPIQNLPYGIFDAGKGARAGVAIGNHILDLAEVAQLGSFDEIGINKAVFEQKTLNDFIALGKKVWTATREQIFSLLSEGNQEIQPNKATVLVEMAKAKMLMPVQVGDYTDFYSSIEHATNVGIMFRGKDNALMPNWRHIPVGYHGRASSIVVSGTDIHRPKGQTMPPEAEKPIFGASKRMDFELEMAFIVGKETKLGDNISTKEAEDHIFGFTVFNDWSARDIQKWEYVPLGPFLGKNFGSSSSPWIVTLDALEPFRVESPKQEPEVLDYLKCDGKHNFDIQLEVDLTPENGEKTTISKSNFKYMYWNICQQLAHHTVNGCNVNVGDMLASGTISGKTEDSYGSMLELSWAGKKDIPLKDGSTRKFIADNDTIAMRGFCEKDGLRIGFGKVEGKILPAK
ncbi:MAG: fumarylacetoacetase [Arenicella sp.]|jgi:fumarylacetoacetase